VAGVETPGVAEDTADESPTTVLGVSTGGGTRAAGVVPGVRPNNPPPNPAPPPSLETGVAWEEEPPSLVVVVAADNPPKLNPLPLGAFFLFDVDDEEDDESSPPPPLRLNNPPPNAGAGGVVAAAGADGPPKLNPVEALGAVVVVVVEGLAEAGAAPPKLNPTLVAASLPLDDVEKENPAGGLVVAAGAPKLKAIVCLAFFPPRSCAQQAPLLLSDESLTSCMHNPNQNKFSS